MLPTYRLHHLATSIELAGEPVHGVVQFVAPHNLQPRGSRWLLYRNIASRHPSLRVLKAGFGRLA